MGFLLFLAVVALVVVAWTKRVQILAKVLGQSEERVRRQIERKRR